MIGLDQYLVADIHSKETNNLTGACGGLFPMAPKSDKTEVGYWRKHYALDRLVKEIKDFSDDEWDTMNCKDVMLTEKNCRSILSYAQEEMQEMESWYDDNIEELMDSNDGWDYSKWSKTVEIMEKALRLIELGGKIYYKYWR